MIVNARLEANNVNAPIQYDLDESMYMDLEAAALQKGSLFISKGTAHLYDNLFFAHLNEKRENFYSKATQQILNSHYDATKAEIAHIIVRAHITNTVMTRV